MASRWWRRLTRRTPAGETLRPRFTHLVRHPSLPPRRLVDRQADTCLFDLGREPLLEDRLRAADLHQHRFAAGLAEVLEPVKLSRLSPIILQACNTLPSCLARSNTPTFAPILFCSLVIRGPRLLRHASKQARSHGWKNPPSNTTSSDQTLTIPE